MPDFNKAIELNSNYADAYFGRGNTKGKLSDYKGAILDFDKAIELNPDLAIAYMGRGLAKHFLGDNDGACIDWNKAAKLGFVDPDDNIKKYCK